MRLVYWAFGTLLLWQKIVLVSFLTVVAVICVWSSAIVIGEAVRCLRGKKPSRRPRWRRICRVCVLSLAGMALLCAAYAYFIEPYWPEVSKFRVATSKLPKGARPIRIVHISDTHCDAKVRLERRLPDIIAALKPDVIVFTGDAVNSDEGIPNFRRLMSQLAAIAPTYAVRGNWDHFHDTDLYAGTGAMELRGLTLPIRVHGTTLYLVGVAWPNWPAAPRLLKELPPGALTVMLYHEPDIVERVVCSKADALLVGHTHGGQITLPFYGAMVTLTEYGTRYERGMYFVNGTWMHVSRGIGMEGGHVPRMRFLARPDVSVIEIVPRE